MAVRVQRETRGKCDQHREFHKPILILARPVQSPMLREFESYSEMDFSQV